MALDQLSKAWLENYKMSEVVDGELIVVATGFVAMLEKSYAEDPSERAAYARIIDEQRPTIDPEDVLFSLIDQSAGIASLLFEALDLDADVLRVELCRLLKR